MSTATIPAAAPEIKVGRLLSANDCTHCFAVPGASSMIDLVHPITGRTCCFDNTLEEVQQRAPGAVLMSVDDWIASKAAQQDSPITWKPTTADTYDEMLNVLPPAAWSLGVFLVGEPYDHHAVTGQPRFSCYLKAGDHYTVASRPITRKEFNQIVEAKRAAL